MRDARWPARYDIGVVGGALDVGWSEWFEGLHIESQGDETTLSGTLPDQSALLGILEKLADLGLSVVTVRRKASQTGLLIVLTLLVAHG